MFCCGLYLGGFQLVLGNIIMIITRRVLVHGSSGLLRVDWYLLGEGGCFV